MLKKIKHFLKVSRKESAIIKNYNSFSILEKTNLKKYLLFFYNKNFPDSVWSEKYFDSILLKKETILLVLQKNNQLAGFVLAKKSLTTKKSLNLCAILVDKDFQHCGFGKMLVKKLLLQVKKNTRISSMYLHFREKNKLEKFYQKLGFKNIVPDGFYKNGDKKYRMEISLKNFTKKTKV